MSHVTRATAAVIGDTEGRVLLVQQTNGQRRWGLPGAHIEPGELPTAAVIREIRRETGLETKVVDLVGLYHLTGGLAGDDEVLPDLITYAFRCEVVTGEAVLNAQGRICHLSWHSPQHVPQPVTTTATAAVADAAAGRSGVVRHLAR
jgi:ADP-ribose pyrophosphatase YjhB (NUDIX family)